MAESDAATIGGLRVSVAASRKPGEVQEWSLQLPVGASVADALAASVAAGYLEQVAASHALCGIWGRVVQPDDSVCDGDRVELYRPLTVDPKVARRERFARQGARTTGLFARQRPGGKAGY